MNYNKIEEVVRKYLKEYLKGDFGDINMRVSWRNCEEKLKKELESFCDVYEAKAVINAVNKSKYQNYRFRYLLEDSEATISEDFIESFIGEALVSVSNVLKLLEYGESNSDLETLYTSYYDKRFGTRTDTGIFNPLLHRYDSIIRYLMFKLFGNSIIDGVDKKSEIKFQYDVSINQAIKAGINTVNRAQYYDVEDINDYYGVDTWKDYLDELCSAKYEGVDGTTTLVEKKNGKYYWVRNKFNFSVKDKRLYLYDELLLRVIHLYFKVMKNIAKISYDNFEDYFPGKYDKRYGSRGDVASVSQERQAAFYTICVFKEYGFSFDEFIDSCCKRYKDVIDRCVFELRNEVPNIGYREYYKLYNVIGDLFNKEKFDSDDYLEKGMDDTLVMCDRGMLEYIKLYLKQKATNQLLSKARLGAEQGDIFGSTNLFR